MYSIDESQLPEGSVHADDLPWNASLMHEVDVNLRSLRQLHAPRPSSVSTPLQTGALQSLIDEEHRRVREFSSQQRLRMEGLQRMHQDMQDQQDRESREQHVQDTRALQAQRSASAQVNIHTAVEAAAQQQLALRGESDAIVRVLSNSGSVSLRSNPHGGEGGMTHIARVAITSHTATRLLLPDMQVSAASTHGGEAIPATDLGNHATSAGSGVQAH